MIVPRLFRRPYGRESVGRRVVVDVYDPDPIGTIDARALAQLTAGQLDGGRLGGFVHYGMAGSPSLSFTGPVASPQQFIGQAQMGKTSAVVVQAYPALPNAAPPPASRQWLQDWTETEELLS